MIFPGGQVVYENLNTAYTQFDAMLAQLRSNSFTGYVKLVGWQYEGIMVLDKGTVVNAIDEMHGELRSGTIVAETLVEKAHERDSTISVYRLTEEMAQALAGLHNGEAIYRDLESEFTNLERLVAKLASEKFSGYVQIRSKANSDFALVLMRDGNTASLWSQNGTTLSGPEALPKILETAAASNALLTVYRTDLREAHRKGADLTDSLSRQEVLAFWRALLNQVEVVVDQQMGAETFAIELRRACVAHVDKYSFLDPFAAEFEYLHGEIKFEGQASLAELNQGLRAAVCQVISELFANTNKKELTTKLRPVAEQMESKYSRLLSQIGLTSELPELFGTAKAGS